VTFALSSAAPRVLLFRIEPADYMQALAHALKDAWCGPIDVVYMSRALTQSWGASGSGKEVYLPPGRLASVLALRRRIDETQPALLHVAGWRTHPALAAIFIGSARGLPVVVDLDTWRGEAAGWRAAVKNRTYPWLLGRVSHFAPGGSRQAAYLRNFGVPGNKITKTNMSVDVAGIRASLSRAPDAGAAFRARHGLKPDAIVALFVGRLMRLKGLEDLLATWSQIAAAVPLARLVIAGDGELRDMVLAAAARDQTILPVGRLSGEDVWHAYASADFVVAPSHREAWGLVVNEAMAAGAPPILTEVFGCVGDLARHMENALIVPPHRPDELANAMLTLARDPLLRARLAREARSIISHWTIQAQAEKISGIWRRALMMEA
jgi:glycosyltransferase involved in cell wall biosynthesis